jgi:hypothetical protein
MLLCIEPVLIPHQKCGEFSCCFFQDMGFHVISSVKVKVKLSRAFVLTEYYVMKAYLGVEI